MPINLSINADQHKHEAEPPPEHDTHHRHGAGLEGGPDNHMRSCSKVAKLQKLKASTRYEYIVTMPSENTPPLSGHFTTFHSPGAKSVVTFTFSSCLGYWPLSSIFPLKWLSPSDFFLLLGDSIYADWPWNMGLGYEALYLNLVQDRHFKALSRSVPVVAMFDDHEIKGEHLPDGTVLALNSKP
jgi:phosphodiesterase/alkaline phosphatase D-like protein